jgi:acetyl esterase/lipase
VPQFYVSDRIFRADHRFTHVRYAHIWSGDALLRALDEIDRTVPIEKKRLRLHGVASGAGFACHFAAWRPDLVTAVSVNSGNWGMPRFQLDGLQPMSAQKGIRYFITASADDHIHRAHDFSVDFVTRLRGAGVAVDWRVWPGAMHTPTFEMEEASRDFLKNQLSE